MIHDLTEGKAQSVLWRFTIPLFISVIFQQLYNLSLIHIFILVNYDPAYTLREGGCLADIAPTMIEMMGMEQPKEMTGKSLLLKK